MNRYSPLAAAAVAFAALLPFLLPTTLQVVSKAVAADARVVMAPDGGRLDAFDRDGNLLGPCTLRHTDVKVEISGRFTRVTLTQKYHNTHADKIEAVYTFPLSHKAGVDRMMMTIGDRVIVGEVKERQQARRIYEAARDAGRVASLLEQERPNIFTQSIANIEPGATIDIEISYVELVTERDGAFQFDFPTVVGPRYIPGGSTAPAILEVQPTAEPGEDAPAKLKVEPRRGVVLLGPASVRVVGRGEAIARSDRGVDERLLNAAINGATPVLPPANALTDLAYFKIECRYADGSVESGVFRKDGFGHVGGRWFHLPPPEALQPGHQAPEAGPGGPFAQPTDQVPDADRITPMPTRPGTRAGHDLSISVMLDTGGPGILDLESPMHRITRTTLKSDEDGLPRRMSIALERLSEIPNRDFVLRWRQVDDQIGDRVFVHAGGLDEPGQVNGVGGRGGFVAIQLDPPARVSDEQAVPRELVFVVDTSGSMNGEPMEACKRLMHEAIESMRPLDRFNVITFAGHTQVLWPDLRPNTPANRAEALGMLQRQRGAGGTEMMKAIQAALGQPRDDRSTRPLTPAELADLPADGREVVVTVDDGAFDSERMEADGTTVTPTIRVRDGLLLQCSSFRLPESYLKKAHANMQRPDVRLSLTLTGAWSTQDGQRLLNVRSAALGEEPVRPLRIVMFLTDAYVGNDMAIIDAIKRHRSTTRVFSFGIGNSVNRWLVEEMARVGGGEPEFVYIGRTAEKDIASSIERFNRRTRTPVLTDIRVTFNGVAPTDVLPELSNIPDLFDNRPLTILGRYQNAGSGSVTIQGQTGRGPWERTIPLTLPARSAQHSSLPVLWARAKIDALMGLDLVGMQTGTPNPDVKSQIVALGEEFNVMSQYTSFVAVDKLRVTLGGKPRLVHVPVELPDQTNWEGFFGPIGADNGAEPSDRAGVSADQATATERVLTLKAEALQRLRTGEIAGPSPGDDSLGHSTSRDDLAFGRALTPPEQKTTAPPAPTAAPMPATARMPAAASPAPTAMPKPSARRGDALGGADGNPTPGELVRPAAPIPPSDPPAREVALPGTLSDAREHRRPGEDVLGSRSGMTELAALALGAETSRGRSMDRTLHRVSDVAWLRLLGATQLAMADDLEGARRITCAPLPPIGIDDADTRATEEPRRELTRACQTLGDPTVDMQARGATLVELRAKASAAIESIAREDKVKVTLADDLLGLSTASVEPTSAQRVRIVVLVSRLTPEVLAAIRALGMRVESEHAEVRVVIGSLPVQRLRDLALLSAVRRVERVQE